MRIAVIGRGLIGSAAARHLARAGHEVVLIGPDEPVEMATHQGVFGSHYDEGRITRRIDPDGFWARVSAESIARYGEIAAQGGEGFYTESGLIFSGPVAHPEIVATEAVARAGGYAHEVFDGAALSERFPALGFETGTRALFEPRQAGHINPRALVRAQTRAAQVAGAEIRVTTARALEAGGARVCCDDGEVEADQVLVAAGGFTDVVLPEPLDLRVLARTILLAELSPEEAARLRDVPAIIHYFADGGDIYLVPPLRYPDGRTYLKIGGDPRDVPLVGMGEIGDWFRSGGDPGVGAILEARLRGMFPGLAIRRCRTQACVTTYSDEDRPVLRRLTDRLSVATAGCGRGAKCSDELGRLGAEVALGRDLPDWARAPGSP